MIENPVDTATPGRNGRLDGLQVARGVAAVSVVLTHAVAHPFAGAPDIAHLLGRYGVTLFFLISGYIMVLTTGAQTFDPIAFMRRRILRVVPIYYLANAVLLAAVIVVPSAFKSTVFKPEYFLKSLAFVPTRWLFDADYIFPFFRLGWTLNYEMFFYVCFAACAALSLKGRIITITAVFVALVALGATLVDVDGSAAAVFYTRVDVLAFVIGMWMAAFARRDVAPLPSWVNHALGLLSMVALVGIAVFYSRIRADLWTQLVLDAVCFIHLRLIILRYDAHGATASRFALLIGDASYSIYLFHMFAVGIIVAVANRLGGIWLFVAMPVAMVAGVSAGVVVYKLVEVPLTRGLRRFR